MIERIETLLKPVLFIVIAILLCGLIFESTGYSALLMYRSIIEGAFIGSNALEKSLRWALPLYITAVGVGISFRCGFFNIGAQGQFYIGAIFAAFVANSLAGAPPYIVVPIGMVAGMTGGALWALWPGILRLWSGTDEVITTLMGNFIAALVLVYVTSGPLKDPSGTGQQASTRILPPEYRISDSMGLSPAIIAITISVGVLGWLLLNRTAFGALADLAGRNPTMLRFQGGNIWKLGLASFVISGALAGLAGSIELFGPSGRVVSGFLPAHGFTAILVALVAHYSVLAIAVAAVFFGGLFSATLFLPILAGLPASAIDLFNAVIAVLITARLSLRNWFRTTLSRHQHD